MTSNALAQATKEAMRDELVEKAARAIFDVRDDEFDLTDWDDRDPSIDRERYECDARAAVEAVLPALFEAGRRAGITEAADEIHNEAGHIEAASHDFRTPRAFDLACAQAAVLRSAAHHLRSLLSETEGDKT